MKKVKINKKFASIELSFTKKPSEKILKALRSSDFKWAPTKSHWHAKKTAKNDAFAKSLGASVQTKMTF